MLPGCAQPKKPTTIVFTGGTVLTVDREFSEAEAIAIRGKLILGVGTNAEVRSAAGADAQIVDLAGKTLLPGFIDPHTHFRSQRLGAPRLGQLQGLRSGWHH